MMDQTDDVRKLRVLLPHWIEHNGEHAGDFRKWAGRAGPAQEALEAAADLVQQANARLANALEQLGGPLELPQHAHPHDGDVPSHAHHSDPHDHDVHDQASGRDGADIDRASGDPNG
jgi:hypothetical protein